MKVKVFTAVSVVLVLFTLCSCASRSLPEGFENVSTTDAAKQLITVMSNKDYDKASEMFSDAVAESVSPEKLEEAFGEKIDVLGELKEFKGVATAGDYNEQIGNFVVVALSCKYENGKATYKVSVDSDGKICGLYMK